MSFPQRSKPIDLKGRRIFVTGGTGFLGRSLLDYLLEAESIYDEMPQVTLLSRSPAQFLLRFPEYADHSWLNLVQGDLEHLPQVTPGTYTDIIHGAADTHKSDDSKLWLSQLVDGTRNVLEFADRVHVNRLLFISSGAVYGAQLPNVKSLRESQPFAPLPTGITSTYGHGKRMAEQLCTLYAAQSKDVECVIARCFAIVSRHIPFDGPYAVGNFMRDALAGQGIHISGNGQTIRSYIAGRDMAHWLFTLLYRGRSGEAYNVGSHQPISTLELATLIRDIVGIDQSILVGNSVDSSGRSFYLPCTEKAQELDLSVETSLRDELMDIARVRQAG